MKKPLLLLLIAVSAISLTSCNSSDDSSLDELIESLNTTYINGGESTPEATFINSSSGTVSSYSPDGTFTLILTGKTKMKFTFDETLLVYGAETFGNGDTVTVSYTDRASADHKKALPAIAITVFDSAQTSDETDSSLYEEDTTAVESTEETEEISVEDETENSSDTSISEEATDISSENSETEETVSVTDEP